jgi:hypothetical protein
MNMRPRRRPAMITRPEFVKDPVEVVRVIDPGALLSSARWRRRFGDSRVHMSDAELRAQFSQAVAIRDEISRLTRDVRELRCIKQQVAARNDLVHGMSAADPLVKGSTDLIAKLDELESRIHNPKAEVVYDILAFRGGAKLYSRLSSLYDAATDSDGVPTDSVRALFADEKKLAERSD